MSFRGRGRGRGFGGRGQSERAGKKEPYILFPGEVSLPSLPNVDTMSNVEKRQITSKYRLERFWLGSCYHLEQVVDLKAGKKSKAGKRKEWEDVEIERYSDRFKKKTEAKREELESYLKLTATSFPTELIQGQKQKQRSNKKLRWGGHPADKKLDEFEELEEKSKGQDGKEAKKEENDEEEPEGDEEEEESSDDGDYTQNVDFDDDEDDLNMEEEQDEDYYE